MTPTVFPELATPAALVDVDRMHANLDRMADYTRGHGLGLRPHIKTHKIPALAAEQLRRGAMGLTCATALEAETMSGVADELLVAFPPVDPHRIARLLALPEHVRLLVGLDSAEALRRLSQAAAGTRRGSPVGVLVELDLGMHRVGVEAPDAAIALARLADSAPGIAYRGVMFYPGHIRQRVGAQGAPVARLGASLARFLDALDRAGLTPAIVSGGSTPAAFVSHRVPGLSEIRPGTYIFNDRATAAMGACAWNDCAFSVLATVVSTAVSDQAVVDAGAKALAREEVPGLAAPGFGALLERPTVPVRAVSEEHGLLDLSGTDWRPRVGERVRIVPNHVCVAVNLHDRLWAVSGDAVRDRWDVAARGH